MNPKACSLALGCVLALWCGHAAALDPALDVSQYDQTAWRIRDGITNGIIFAIAQTPDGYLWLGTDAGLAHFDGIRSIPWQPPAGTALPDSRIRALLVARDGTLWIGTNGGLASWNGRELVVHPRFGGAKINGLVEDHEGTVWVSAGFPAIGLFCEIRGTKTACHGEDGSLGLGQDAPPLYVTRDGSLWFSNDHDLWRWRPGTPKHYSLPAPVPRSFQQLSDGDRGSILALTRNGIEQVVNDRLEAVAVPGPYRNIGPDFVLRDRDGALWITLREAGLLHIHSGRADAVGRADGLSSDVVTKLFEDREGDIWVATSDGLNRFRAFAAATYSTQQGVSGTAASVLADEDGSVWISTDDGLFRWRDGQLYAYRASSTHPATSGLATPAQATGVKEVVVPGLPARLWASLFQDRRGRIWLGAEGGFGYLKNDRLVPVKAITTDLIDSIAEDSLGNLWIAHRHLGLLRLSPDLAVQPVKLGVGAMTGDAWRLAGDPVRGGLWVGLSTGGVVHLADGRIDVSYSAADGLGKGAVNQLRVATDGNLWVATDGGLSRIKDGRIATLTTRSGLPCDAVNATIEDDAGSIWIYTACGLARIQRADLDAWIATVNHGQEPSRIPLLVLSDVDGVRSVATPGSSASPHLTKTRDGRLWFSTVDGVSVVDPRDLHFNALPPPVRVEQLVADGASHVASSPVHLAPLVRDLEIDYAALSLVAPDKNRFRYRLEGRDRDWQDAGNRRQAFYTDLGPGSYRFRVIAANNSGVWNGQGAALDFSIAPAYWQTGWFRTLCAAAFFLVLWVLYVLRARELARRFNMTLDARVNERTRIARELHDTLLQSFHGLLMRFQTVRELMPGRLHDATQLLDSTIDQAAEAITEGRNAVQDLRSSTLETNDLAAAIQTLGREIAGHEGADAVRLSLKVEGTSQTLHPIVRDEIYRVAGEALRNAYRHSGAKQIEVELCYDEHRVRLRIRDDGKGIDPQVLGQGGREGHFGLHGMRERAVVIGGKLAVWSAPDSGTEIELTVPASRAFAKSLPLSFSA